MGCPQGRGQDLCDVVFTSEYSCGADDAVMLVMLVMRTLSAL